MSDRDEFFQSFVLTDHPEGTIEFRIYADRVLVQNGMTKITVPLTNAALARVQRMVRAERSHASTSTH